MNGFVSQVIQGAWINVALSLCAILFGLSLSILFTVGSFSSYPFARWIVFGLTGILRGVPELLVLFATYFGGSVVLSALFHKSIEVNAFFSGVFALGLIFSAYATQTWRGAFLAIASGQSEAAHALGLSRWVIFKKILLPQAWQHALPGLGNLWLTLLKDSALVALIGLADIMNRSQSAAATTQQPFKFYLIATGVFLILTSLSQWLLAKWYRHSRRSLIMT